MKKALKITLLVISIILLLALMIFFIIQGINKRSNNVITSNTTAATTPAEITGSGSAPVITTPEIRTDAKTAANTTAITEANTLTPVTSDNGEPCIILIRPI